jgi:precorrin-3B C17-methyltransferase
MNTVQGRLSVVGTGPGSVEHLTGAAVQALHDAEVIVGYTGYIRQIESLIQDKQRFSTGMRGEKERVAHAIALAEQGARVAVVSGGDAGVYGMAGLVLEMLGDEQLERIALEIIPGVTAASAAASCLGAPLMHDFAVISLSDLLTSPELIERRLLLAAEGDFVTVLYNPKSRTRNTLIRSAVEVFRQHRKPDTPAAIVSNAYRENERVELLSLETLDPDSPSIDMSSVVIIGNCSSYRKGMWFVTPRGYRIHGE